MAANFSHESTGIIYFMQPFTTTLKLELIFLAFRFFTFRHSSKITFSSLSRVSMHNRCGNRLNKIEKNSTGKQRKSYSLKAHARMNEPMRCSTGFRMDYENTPPRPTTTDSTSMIPSEHRIHTPFHLWFRKCLSQNGLLKRKKKRIKISEKTGTPMQSLYISAKYQAPAAHMNAFRFTFLGFQKAQFAIFFQISRMESRCLTSPVFNLAS